MKLEELRKEIDKIDSEMAILFEKRMEVVKKIIEYKKNNNISILDIKRESEIIKKNGSYVLGEFSRYYHDYLKCVMEISKNYQNDNYE